MSNTPSWMGKWQRSPRQDRRVIVDGKFVEQGPVHTPEPPQEEQPQSALEIVKTENTASGTEFEEGRYVENEKSESEKLQEQLEPIDAVAEHIKGSQTVAEIADTVTEDVDKAFDFLEIPPIPSEAWQFIEEAQQAAESVIAGTVEPAAVLPAVSENTDGTNVLDGPVGRVETAIDEQGHQEIAEPTVAYEEAEKEYLGQQSEQAGASEALQGGRETLLKRGQD